MYQGVLKPPMSSDPALVLFLPSIEVAQSIKFGGHWQGGVVGKLRIVCEKFV
jgi:hypothetical protein